MQASPNTSSAHGRLRRREGAESVFSMLFRSLSILSILILSIALLAASHCRFISTRPAPRRRPSRPRAVQSLPCATYVRPVRDTLQWLAISRSHKRRRYPWPAPCKLPMRRIIPSPGQSLEYCAVGARQVSPGAAPRCSNNSSRFGIACCGKGGLRMWDCCCRRCARSRYCELMRSAT